VTHLRRTTLGSTRVMATTRPSAARRGRDKTMFGSQGTTKRTFSHSGRLSSLCDEMSTHAVFKYGNMSCCD
jgi:hypothetical protein